MNKNFLLLGGVAVAFLYFRNKSSSSPSTPTSPALLPAGASGGTRPPTATTYAPTHPATAGSSAGSNWLNTIANGATTVNNIVQTGTQIWHTVTNSAPTSAQTVAGQTDPTWGGGAGSPGSGPIIPMQTIPGTVYDPNAPADV